MSTLLTEYNFPSHIINPKVVLSHQLLIQYNFPPRIRQNAIAMFSLFFGAELMLHIGTRSHIPLLQKQFYHTPYHYRISSNCPWHICTADSKDVRHMLGIVNIVTGSENQYHCWFLVRTCSDIKVPFHCQLEPRTSNENNISWSVLTTGRK